MKTTLAILLILSSVASANPLEKTVTINIREAMVPERVENQADVKIVLSGRFPNTCYRWDRAEIADTSPTTHIVRARAIVSITNCAMMLVPFSQDVNLGRLVRGQHTLLFVNGDGTSFQRNLVVE